VIDRDCGHLADPSLDSANQDPTLARQGEMRRIEGTEPHKRGRTNPCVHVS